MMIFLVLKERLKSFYGKYATPVNGVIKFIYSFVAMALLNGNIGYQTELTGPVAMAVVALFSAFFPMVRSGVCWEQSCWHTSMPYLWRLRLLRQSS